MAQPTASAPTLRNYAYLRPLGSGGFADVFLYEQVRPRREVAVKVLRTATPADPHDLRRDTEADLMATVSRHPYIVTVLEADVAPDGREYIVMEYYPGQSLAARVRQGPLSTAEVLRIGIQLCGAVETAHRHGIVHRDIKPANILTDAYAHPKLTDFGIAGRRGERGDGAMSPPWSAPEIISGRAAPDESTDVYSLAATLWHLLAGRAPFEETGGDNSPVALRRRTEQDPVPWIGREDVPPALERVLQQALSKNPTVRPASALGLARALQSVQQELGHAVLEPEIPHDETPHLSYAEESSTTSGPVVDLTDVRPLQVTAQPAPSANTRPPGAPPLADTQVREGVDTPAPSPIPEPASDTPTPRRAVAILAGALAVLVASSGLVLFLTRETTTESSAPTAPASASAQDVLAPPAPPPAPTGSARRLSDSRVDFTWSVSDPGAVAFYVIRRTDAGSGVRPEALRVTAARYTLTPVGPHDVPCLEIRSGGKGGATSAPVKVCL